MSEFDPYWRTRNLWRKYVRPIIEDPTILPPLLGRPFFKERGDLRFIVLMLLKDKPLHGYALMKEANSKFKYNVGAGTIYPTLQMLEDLGYIKVVKENGRKVFSVTETGLQHLAENEQEVKRIEDSVRYTEKFNGFEFKKDISEMFRLIASNVDYINEKKREAIERVVKKAKEEVRSIIFE
jgi:DNA-binding PadR family transcriptional regulator